MPRLSPLVVRLESDIGKFRSDMRAAAGDVEGFSQRARRAMLITAGAAATAATAVSTASVKIAGDFQSLMGDVQTLLGPKGAGRILELGEDVKRLSKETGKPLRDLSGGLYEVVSAFGDSAESVKKLDIATKSAIAGTSTTKAAIQLLSAVTKGYGDTSAAATQHVADLAFQTVKLGQTTFPELARSIGMVVPGAAALGVEVETVAGLMATLTGVTGDTSRVATQLQGVFAALRRADPGTELHKMLVKIGFGSAQAAIEAIGLQNVLRHLAVVMDYDAIALGNLFGRVEAGNAILALASGQVETFKEKLKSMSDVGGVATEAYNIKMREFWRQLERIRQQIIVGALDLGQKYLPALQKIGDWVEQNMPTIQKWIDDILAAMWNGMKKVLYAIADLLGYWDQLLAKVKGIGPALREAAKSIADIPGGIAAGAKARFAPMPRGWMPGTMPKGWEGHAYVGGAEKQVNAIEENTQAIKEGTNKYREWVDKLVAFWETPYEPGRTAPPVVSAPPPDVGPEMPTNIRIWAPPIQERALEAVRGEYVGSWVDVLWRKITLRFPQIAESVESSMWQIQSSISHSLTSVIMGTMKFEDALKQIGYNILERGINMLLQIATGAFLPSSMGGGGGGGGGLVALLGPLGGLFHQGGIPCAHAGFVGRDERLVMAQAGEGIINRADTRTLLSAGVRATQQGGEGEATLYVENLTLTLGDIEISEQIGQKVRAVLSYAS